MVRYLLASATVVALGVLQPELPAQIPGVPAVPAIPGTAGAAPAAAPAAPNNIWSFLCPTPAQTQACCQKLCACPLVQMLGGTLTPISAVSGGLIPQCCPGPNQANPADLQQPSDSAQGAAARIKQKEAQAKARRAAVRYLGTVDCRRYPEAETALINALRADENECVRYEAALAFAGGCCCTKKVLEALVVTVSGKKTNDPAELSQRVKHAAAVALQRCLSHYCEVELIAPADKPAEPAKPASAVQARVTPDPLVAEGREVLAAYKAKYGSAAAPLAAVVPPTLEPPTLELLAPTGALPLTQVAATMPVQSVSGPELKTLPTGQRDIWSVLRRTWRSR